MIGGFAGGGFLVFPGPDRRWETTCANIGSNCRGHADPMDERDAEMQQAEVDVTSANTTDAETGAT